MTITTFVLRSEIKTVNFSESKRIHEMLEFSYHVKPLHYSGIIAAEVKLSSLCSCSQKEN